MSTILDVEKNLEYLDVKTVDKNLNTLGSKSKQAPSKAEQIAQHVATWKKLMKQGYRSTLIIKESPPKGLGVFADKDYAKGSTLDYCHCAVSVWKGNYIHEPSYRRYAYWDYCGCQDCKTHGARGAVLLGTGSIVNSAAVMDEANTGVHVSTPAALAVLTAIKDIKAGQELIAWHGEGYYNSWCKPIHEKNKKAAESVESPIRKFDALQG